MENIGLVCDMVVSRVRRAGWNVDRWDITGLVFLVGVHPEVVGVAAKLIAGSVETVVKAEVLWR